MNSWFTVKVKYTKQLDNGDFKRVTEPYLLAAENFTEAETRVHEELGTMIRGEFSVTSIAHTNIHDIFGDEKVMEQADAAWYKCKVSYEDTIDDKPKKISQNYLVAGDSVKDADKRLREGLNGMMIDFDIQSVVVTNIVDIFHPANASAKVGEIQL